MRYILNSAVITTPGVYEYKLITPEEAKKWLEEGDFVSTIGYQETADALEVLTGVRVCVCRTLIEMKEGDEALVFRLTVRLSDPQLKGKLTKEFVIKNSEIGILRKLK